MLTIAPYLLALSTYLPPDLTKYLCRSREDIYTVLVDDITTSENDIYNPLDISCTYVDKLKKAEWNKTKNEMKFSVMHEGESVDVYITETEFRVGNYTYNIHANLLGKVFDNIDVKKINPNAQEFCISAKIGWIPYSLSVSYTDLCGALERLLDGHNIVKFNDIVSLHRN